MIWEGKGIGVTCVARSAKAFTDKELRISQGFADHAVIAIQNARRFNETQASLARQTASADIFSYEQRLAGRCDARVPRNRQAGGFIGVL